MSVGEKLEELRKNRGYTLRDLGDKLNVSYSHLSRIEKGHNIPNLVLLETIADFFGVKPSYFLDDDKTLTEYDEKFLDDIDLPLDELNKKYNLTVDGKKLTPDEIKTLVTFIRLNRMG